VPHLGYGGGIEFNSITIDRTSLLAVVDSSNYLKYRYVRTGADHFSLAFTYAWMAAEHGFLKSFPMSIVQLWLQRAAACSVRNPLRPHSGGRLLSSVHLDGSGEAASEGRADHASLAIAVVERSGGRSI
jgi:hypothetical protein